MVYISINFTYRLHAARVHRFSITGGSPQSTTIESIKRRQLDPTNVTSSDVSSDQYTFFRSCRVQSAYMETSARNTDRDSRGSFPSAAAYVCVKGIT